MFTAASKIKKEKGQVPDEIESQVAQALWDVEQSVSDIKADIRELYISSAKEIDVAGGKKAIILFVPYPQLKAFRKVHMRLVRELEKKFSSKHVVIIAQRRIVSKPSRQQAARQTQERPRSRTLTKVHDAILDDLVYPSEVVDRRTRFRLDGKFYRVYLDRKEINNTEYKLDTFATVYKKLTGKDVTFEFPAPPQETA